MHKIFDMAAIALRAVVGLGSAASGLLNMMLGKITSKIPGDSVDVQVHTTEGTSADGTVRCFQS